MSQTRGAPRDEHRGADDRKPSYENDRERSGDHASLHANPEVTHTTEANIVPSAENGNGVANVRSREGSADRHKTNGEAAE
jgi:hypothetical protein